MSKSNVDSELAGQLLALQIVLGGLLRENPNIDRAEDEANDRLRKARADTLAMMPGASGVAFPPVFDAAGEMVARLFAEARDG